IFDYNQAMASGDSHDTIHVARLTVKMNRYDRLGLRSNSTDNVVGIDLPSIGQTIGKYRRCADIGNDIDRGNKCQCRDDNLVTWSDPQRHNCKMQGGGAIARGERVAATEFRRKLLLEFSYVCPSGDPRTLKTFGQVPCFVSPEGRAIQGNQNFRHRHLLVDRLRQTIIPSQTNAQQSHCICTLCRLSVRSALPPKAASDPSLTVRCNRSLVAGLGNSTSTSCASG